MLPGRSLWRSVSPDAMPLRTMRRSNRLMHLNDRMFYDFRRDGGYHLQAGKDGEP